MSQKWRRSQQWDREHFPAWAWPVRAILHAFSSITLAVILLSLVVVYATLASVPIGLLALAPTYAVYALTLAASIAVVSGIPVFVARRVLWNRVGRAPLFVGSVVGGIVLGVVGIEVWHLFLWPALQYDPASGRGLRLFASFCEAYKATTLRRLPGVEMSELEFYSWWPLRVILLAFVANMITATVRRIEFIFVNIGVLTVHTGIVVIALGSIYYHRLKLEGDTLLLAGEAGPDGAPTPGPLQDAFYDNTRVALWVFKDHVWEQRGITGLPRYNDYNLGAGGSRGVLAEIGRAPSTESDAGRTLDLPVPTPSTTRIDADVRFRIVGYATYAVPVTDWLPARPGDPGTALEPNPIRFASMLSSIPDERGVVPRGPVARFYFMPHRTDGRLAENDAFGIEWTREMPPARWAALTTPVPDGALHALVVEIPRGGERGFRETYAVNAGSEVRVGDTGWTLRVKEVMPRPPFPIITEGYQGASSIVLVVRVTGPDGAAFDRWLYHRFPEISQDMLDGTDAAGMPARRPADPVIRIDYLDLSKLQVYLDDRSGGKTRAIVRRPRGEIRVLEDLAVGSVLDDLVPGIGLSLDEAWPDSVALERPRVVPEQERRKEDVGTHSQARIAVEVSAGDWRQVIWLPFSRYLGIADRNELAERSVRLPDGRRFMLAFGRRMHRLPGFMIQLIDFTMLAYQHRGAPRDYQSIVRVVPTDGSFEGFEHVTKLNAPLQAPFMWSQQRNWIANALGTIASRLSPRQFKFSQAGWDKGGWEQTQALVDAGRLGRPSVRFTILGVGNNPGIHIIAAGGVLVSVGIPWAFYVKPWLLRRRKSALQRQVAGGRFSGHTEPGDVTFNGEAARPERVGVDA